VNPVSTTKTPGLKLATEKMTTQCTRLMNLPLAAIEICRALQ
jgi:hypothetical protein